MKKCIISSTQQKSPKSQTARQWEAFADIWMAQTINGITMSPASSTAKIPTEKKPIPLWNIAGILFFIIMQVFLLVSFWDQKDITLAFSAAETTCTVTDTKIPDAMIPQFTSSKIPKIPRAFCAFAVPQKTGLLTYTIILDDRIYDENIQKYTVYYDPTDPDNATYVHPVVYMLTHIATLFIPLLGILVLFVRIAVRNRGAGMG